MSTLFPTTQYFPILPYIVTEEALSFAPPLNNLSALLSLLLSPLQPAYLIYGRTGWIGGELGKLLTAQGAEWSWATGRMENRNDVLADISRGVGDAKRKPTHILLAAGVTGRPNVDWCETNKIQTVRANVMGVLTVADVCRDAGLHVTYYGSGCIYRYDPEHPLGSGKGFTESDLPNFSGSFYSKTKGMVETLLRNYENVLTLRIRMPLSADFSNPRNFVVCIY